MANHPLTVYLRGHYVGGHTALRRLREQATSNPTNDRRTFLARSPLRLNSSVMAAGISSTSTAREPVLQVVP